MPPFPNAFAKSLRKEDREAALQEAMLSASPRHLLLHRPALCSDRAVMTKAVTREGRLFDMASEQLLNDAGLALLALTAGHLRKIGSGLKVDRAFAMRAVQFEAFDFGLLDEAVRADPEICLAAIRSRSIGSIEDLLVENIYNIPSALLESRVVADLVATHEPYSFQHLTEEFRNERSLALQVVSHPKEGLLNFVDSTRKLTKKKFCCKNLKKKRNC